MEDDISITHRDEYGLVNRSIELFCSASKTVWRVDELEGSHDLEFRNKTTLCDVGHTKAA
jgi:hypothetical protein